ncbi:hypothetical protein EGI22_08345 [Lacihabitans sp. LS3-19]|uniref:hypothetical protein n=1 Tax=Lacihabitans sp. LS3-19 TaxID=2487335 RepID=UPI0020CCC02C|nr:hypothetical protein [Lacihabitans sp. LS3-19]MCP9767919.1 hypothetical protein [Lacihabitans sp. LS3-19]
MQTFSIEIINPKAISLLNDLVALDLIAIKEQKKNIQKKTLKKLLLEGPNWTEENENEVKTARESINKVGNGFA